MNTIYFSDWHLKFHENILLYLNQQPLLKFASWLQSPVPLILALLAVCIYLFFRRDWRQALFFLVSVILLMAISESIATILKKIIAMPRPAMIFLHHINYNTFGIPSAHSLNTMALAILCGYLQPRYLKYFIAMSVLVGSSRIVTGHHLPLDILIGLSIGLVLGLGFVWFLKQTQLRFKMTGVH